jgi:hypothetical protein
MIDRRRASGPFQKNAKQNENRKIRDLAAELVDTGQLLPNR